MRTMDSMDTEHPAMDTEHPAGPGLRERKKLEMRQALSRAALRLAMEHGPENVRIEDITTAVGVSYRTFANYFGSREEAIVAVAADRAARTVELFRNRPTDEPLARALVQAFTLPYQDRDVDAAGREQTWLPRLRLRLRQVLAAPTLSGAYLAGRSAAEHSLAEAIAERTNTDAATDLYPRVLASAVLAAEHAAVNFGLDTGTTATVTDLVRQAIEQVAGEPAGNSGN